MTTVIVAAGAGSGEPPPVAAAYVADTIQTIDAAGNAVAAVPAGGSFSLFANLLAGDDGNGISGYDATTGAEVFHVRRARLPVATAGGVFFAPDPGGLRDPQSNSVWLRRDSGRVRKVVQFANGPGLPGYDPGMDGDNGLLSFSLDRRGRTVVVAQGNDVDLFVYDIFAVDVANGAVRRLTSGLRSRWPAVSANGSTVAYQRDRRECGAPFIRAADLMAVPTAGGDATRLYRGRCAGWLHNPRWASPTQVVAYRTSVLGDTYRTDLVLVDVTTAERRRLTRSGRVTFFSTDPRSGRVAFQREGRAGYTIIDLATFGRTTVATGDLPHLNGDTTLL